MTYEPMNDMCGIQSALFFSSKVSICPRLEHARSCGQFRFEFKLNRRQVSLFFSFPFSNTIEEGGGMPSIVTF